MMPNEMMAPEAMPEQESTVTCPNCGAPLKLEMPEQPEAAPAAPAAGGAPSLRDTLTQAMGGGA
jgi:hypothetical protein